MSFTKPTPEEKHDINITMMKFPDSGRFKALNTTSQQAMEVSRQVTAPIMGTRIKNTPKLSQ